MVSARVHYDWGCKLKRQRHGHDGRVKLGATVFDLASYLAYIPLDILSTTALTPANVAAERQAFPAWMPSSCRAWRRVSCTRRRTPHTHRREKPYCYPVESTGPAAWMRIVREGQVVQAQVANKAGYILQTAMGNMIYDRATDATSFTGGLAGGSGTPSIDPVVKTLSFAAGKCGSLQSNPTEEAA